MTEQAKKCTLTKKETFATSDGSGRLVCSVSLPSFDGHERINDFYSRIADACLDFCRVELLRRYASERQGAAWEIRYRLNVRADTAEDTATIALAVTLSDSFSHKILAKHDETHLWSLSSDKMIPDKSRKGVRKC